MVPLPNLLAQLNPSLVSEVVSSPKMTLDSSKTTEARGSVANRAGASV